MLGCLIYLLPLAIIAALICVIFVNFGAHLLFGLVVIISILIFIFCIFCLNSYAAKIIITIALIIANVALYNELFGINISTSNNNEKYVPATLYNESSYQGEISISAKKKWENKWIAISASKGFIDDAHKKANKSIYYFNIPADTEVLKVTTSSNVTYLAGAVDYSKEKDSKKRYTFCYGGRNLFQYESKDIKYITETGNKIIDIDKPESLPMSKQESLIETTQKKQTPEVKKKIAPEKEILTTINKTADENLMTYEQGFWLYMRTNYGEKFLDDVNAQQLYLKTYHPNEYKSASQDQFAMHDALNNIKIEMQKKYAEIIPPEKNIYSVRVSARFTTYDFEKNQFMLKINIPELIENMKIPNDDPSTTTKT